MITRALAGVLLVVAAASTASAQATPEGTPINNTATAAYTDANGNTYSDVTASVSVTVGFKAGVDLATLAASYNAVAGSTGNTIPLTLQNVGNGGDNLQLAETAVPAGVTITGYTWNSTTYATVAALNAALAAAPRTAAGASEAVTLIYSVSAAVAGGSGNLTITLSSGRTPATTNAETTSINFGAAPLLAVTAVDASSSRLPGIASPRYTTTFEVRNPGSAAGAFTFSAGGVQTSGYIVSPASATIAAGGTQVVTVTFDIASGAVAGSAATVVLTATGASLTAGATHTITVIRPNLTITKEVFRNDGTTAIGGSDTVLPGEVITYRVTVTNTGSASATTVSVSDVIPAQLTYLGGSLATGTGTWTSLVEAGGTVTGTIATLSSTAGSNSASFTFKATVK